MHPGIYLCPLLLAVAGFAMWWLFHRRVTYRHIDHPNLVVMWSRAREFGPAAYGTCTICNWTGEHWSTPRYVRTNLMSDLKQHRCPTVEETVAEPVEWEEL